MSSDMRLLAVSDKTVRLDRSQPMDVDLIIIIFIQLQLGRNPVAEVYNTYTANV
jgi:hypothetical protein